MMKNKFFAIAVATFLLFSVASVAGASVKIGVLAKDGPAAALKAWGATGEYLTEKIGQPVEIVPLAFDKVFPAVEAGDVQFFLVNSSMFITAKTKYGAVPVATMINSRQGKSLNSFGGVVFTSAYNDKINSFADLKGKKFAAVSKSSFGGWQMAYKEFVDAGIDPFKDFASMEFLDKHDNVVFAVQNEQVDAGTVRTDTLERMAAAGAISMADFKIIGKKDIADFPFVCSTALYPEWPLSKLAATDDALAAKVVAALKELKPEDKAAKAAKVVGWSDPLDYAGVEALQQSLKVGASAN
ncbi:phosphate/phosphite/phosphonate ABC transporter substrate-binding protein [Desulfopila sp. IMCC35006]|uniref:phosphate/phosphite/phosphonate ABC transporter substrate-binding protein n=1 Tax=Desulfopila sp. IMCC35006 TaxID=2569542 RepID=UPI00142F1C41|nr:phosphate/phosphite/phosphonate ABC transporter substrate-binding protein [Desulfopila sp. IMCC35006]